MNDKCILLPDHTVREEPDLIAWGMWYEKADRVVRRELIGPWIVSTVFLGLDHSYARRIHPEAPPLLFETMVFEDNIKHPITLGGNTIMVRESLPIQERCSTWDEAVAQHERIAGRLRKAFTS